MQRKVEALTSKDAHAEDLQRHIAEQDAQIEAINIRLSEATASLIEVQERASAELVEERRASSVAMQDVLAKVESGKEAGAEQVRAVQERLEVSVDECEVLRLQVAALQADVQKGLGNKKTLEEYKLRAQKAVKQVR
jgi:hypothetical protein